MNRQNISTKCRAVGWGLVMVGALALGGCSGYSGYEAAHPGNPATEGMNLTAARTAALSEGHDFNGSLARDYSAVASRRAQDKDWTDADYFARKSLAVHNGEPVAPEYAAITDNPPALDPSEVSAMAGSSVEPHTWLIPGNGDPNATEPATLNAARERLVAALDAGGRIKFPTLAARAQALYDSWIERSEHLGAAGFNSEARQDFARDYADLAVLVNPPAMRNAYFDYGSARLTTAAQQELKQAATLVKDGTAYLKITGKADRSGTAGYNEALSKQRTMAIRDALIAGGIDTKRIELRWTGENQLPVRTPDGKREPRNRVVQIETLMPSSQVAELTD